MITKLTRAERQERFRKYLNTIAKNSDVTIQPKKLFAAARAIHLSSEDHTDPPESLAFTTSLALVQMFDAWWDEFKLKDGQTGACQIKLKQIFKGFGVRVSLKPYESADGVLSIDPPGNPNGAFAWLPQPPRKIELDEKDVIYWERNGRISLRALNFIEAILQTWKTSPFEEELYTQMRRSISRAVKCILQAQVASVGGQLQARRDQFLSHAKGLSVEEMQQLRHAPISEADKLFPTELMKEIDAQHRQSLQTKALMKTTTKAESKDSGQKKDFKKQNYNNYNHSYNNNYNNYNNNWYEPNKVQVSTPSQACSVTLFEKQGGGQISRLSL